MQKKAFTLLETVVALLLLSISFLVLNAVQSGGLLAFKKSANMIEIAQLLQKKTVEYELLYKNKSFEELKELETGDFGADYPEYTWKVEVQEFPEIDIKSIVESTPGADKSEMNLLMYSKIGEILKNNIIEMKVSVLWKYSDKKTVENSVTVLLVDYKKPINLSM